VNVPGTWSVNSSSLYYNNGNVGIDTSTPAQKLDVTGNASVSGNTTVSGLLTAGTAVVTGSLGVGTPSPTQALDVSGGILARQRPH